MTLSIGEAGRRPRTVFLRTVVSNMAAALKLVPLPVPGTLLPTNETADQVSAADEGIVHVEDWNPDLVRKQGFSVGNGFRSGFPP